MKTATPRVTSKPITRATNGATRERASTPKRLSKSSDPSPVPATPRSSSAIPIRQSTSTNRANAGSPREGNGPSQANSPSKGATRSSSVSKVSPTISNGSSAATPHRSKQILNHDFLSKTPKNRGPSMLARSIDDPSAIHQLRRHSVPSSKVQDYMSRSYDHGSLISYKSNDRGSNFMSRSHDQGPKFLSKSQNQGPRSLSKSQDRGLMSRSQDRGSLTSYTKFQSTGQRKLTVPEYGYDGRRLSTGSKETVQQTPRVSTAMQNALRGDRGSIHLQMGRSVDSTVSLSTAASSPSDRGRGGRQSFRDTCERRLTPLQLSQSQGYRSGDVTPEDTSPLDARAPTSNLRGGTKHRQLKSPDFFDVKKLDGDCGIITAVSRMHNKSNGVGVRVSKEDHDNSPDKHLHSEAHYEHRRDSLAGSSRKAFSVESDSAVGSAHFSEINYKLDKELSGANDLLEIGSWNDDDEEYLRIYKIHDRSADGSFVDILEDTASESAAVGKNNHVEGANSSLGRKKWGELSKGSVIGNHDEALYRKSETGSELDTSTLPSPQESPSRGSPPPKRISATKTDVVSRISSTSATSIDLNRSTDTTCSTHSQYDNAFWSDPPINGNFRPWNPTREAEMSPAVAAARSLPEEDFVPPKPAVVLGSQGPADSFALSEKMALRYDDGLERLTSYMKNASQSARKKRGLSDDLSSQTSGCFDYLVDFLETQTSLADVLVSAHGESRKADFGGLATGTDKADFANANAIKRMDSKLTNDTSLLSNRSMESRITDLGSEASWESGKSRSVQTLGTTGKVMDQITEKVDSLSFDSPKHLSTFKFGLKKTTVGAFETITSSEDQGRQAKEQSAPSSRATSERSFPLQKVSAQLSTPQSPISSWRSQTAPNSHKSSRNPSRNPSRNASRNPSPSQSKRTHSDEKLLCNSHRHSSPLSTSTRQISVVSEGVGDMRKGEDFSSPSSFNQPTIELTPIHGRETKQVGQSSVATMEKKTEGSASPTVEAPAKYVKMNPCRDGNTPSRDAFREQKSPMRVDAVNMTPSKGIGRGVVKRDETESLTHQLTQANKGCGCNIL